MKKVQEVIQEVRQEVERAATPLVESWGVLQAAKIDPEEYARMIQDKKLMDVVTKTLPKNYYFVSDKELRVLQQGIPQPLQRMLPLLVRTGATRILTDVAEVAKIVDKVERSGDHVRDVSIPATPKPEAWAVFPGFLMP